MILLGQRSGKTKLTHADHDDEDEECRGHGEEGGAQGGEDLPQHIHLAEDAEDAQDAYQTQDDLVWKGEGREEACEDQHEIENIPGGMEELLAPIHDDVNCYLKEKESEEQEM